MLGCPHLLHATNRFFFFLCALKNISFSFYVVIIFLNLSALLDVKLNTGIFHFEENIMDMYMNKL